MLQVAQERKEMSYKTTEVSRGKIKPDIFYCPLETCFVIHFCCLIFCVTCRVSVCDGLCFLIWLFFFTLQDFYAC